jgi:hypothetical protein
MGHSVRASLWLVLHFPEMARQVFLGRHQASPTVARSQRIGVLVLTAVLASVALNSRTSARSAQAKDDAERFQQKIDRIGQHAVSSSTEPFRTLITESEVNSYLRLTLRDQIPAGVAEPLVSALGQGRLSAQAIIDLDAIRKEHRSTGWFDPLRYLSGRLPVSARGILRASDGVARFEFESAQVSGIPVPKALLQEIVSYYSRTPSNPAGVNLDEPFPLPARIRAIQVDLGQAIVLQ